eukprot:6206970-Pleurochrysis_carterae.AAC.3
MSTVNTRIQARLRDQNSVPSPGFATRTYGSRPLMENGVSGGTLRAALSVNHSPPWAVLGIGICTLAPLALAPLLECFSHNDADGIVEGQGDRGFSGLATAPPYDHLVTTFTP